MDSFKEIFNLGLGALVVTKEKAEQVVNEMIKQGKIAEGQGKELIDELVKKGEQGNKELEENISNTIKESLTKLDLATKEDIQNLRNEIEELKNK